MRVSTGTELAYETFGDRGARPMVLISGLGRPALSWADRLCQKLADQGRYVVRFDNRDAGQSSQMSEEAPFIAAVVARLLRRPVPSVYSLADLADDTRGLIEAMGLGPVDLVGTSMGGMIAQQLAVSWPEGVASLTSIRSTTGDPSLPLPGFSLLRRLAWAVLAPMSEVDRYVATYRLLNTPGEPLEVLRARAERELARGWHVGGRRRHLCMALGASDRTASLSGLNMPALVVHGDADELLPIAHGQATADALGCRLVVQPGVAHDMPEPCWAELLRDLLALCPAESD